MRILIAINFIVFTVSAFSQGHESWITRISTVEDANIYASKHSDVIVSFVNLEKDLFLFDGIDTANLAQHVGESQTLFGRTTKFLEDTSILMIDLQFIEFDTSSSSEETVNVLHSQILQRLREGESFWTLKKKYAHTSTAFSSGPELVDEVMNNYQLDLHNAEPGGIYEYTKAGRRGIIVVNKGAHKVPGFYAVSFNSSN